ncbi:MAG: hypothetical protein V2J65_01955 [Desulfobacteraceae bacterium]|nr:hypothetical protein [Desulfobacteraceae bacterium]
MATKLYLSLDKWQVAPIAATEIYGQGLIESIDYLEKKMAATRCYGNT